jgi:hypothetical protein
MKVWHWFIHSITSHFRRKRGRFLLGRFPNIHDYRICALGGSRHFWEKIGLNIPLDQITMYNVSYVETGSVSVGGRGKRYPRHTL